MASGIWRRTGAFIRNTDWMLNCFLFRARQPACQPGSRRCAVTNASGGGVASAVVAGADVVLVACYLNSLPYELVVQESIKSAEDLRGKAIGISRLGSASDVAARALIRGLGMEPERQVLIMQVGGSTERAASFRTGRIAGFPSPPGIIHLTQGMPYRILISTADFPKPFKFPYICAATTRSYLSRRRDTVKRVIMAHIEAMLFFKTRKEESKKIVSKYSRQTNETYQRPPTPPARNSMTACRWLRDRAWRCKSKRRLAVSPACSCASRTWWMKASCASWTKAGLSIKSIANNTSNRCNQEKM